MHQMKSYLRGLFVLFVVLGGVIIASTLAKRLNTETVANATTAYQPSAQLTTTPPVPGPADIPEDQSPPAGSASLPSGGPAIKPNINNPNPGEAAFTVEDVERYITAAIAKNELYVGRRIHIESTPQISKIELLTERDLKSRPGGASTGLADGAPLYYVELSGTFRLVSPFPNRVPSETFHKGAIVFNAQTGNIMMAGAGP